MVVADLAVTARVWPHINPGAANPLPHSVSGLRAACGLTRHHERTRRRREHEAPLPLSFIFPMDNGNGRPHPGRVEEVAVNRPGLVHKVRGHEHSRRLMITHGAFMNTSFVVG